MTRYIIAAVLFLAVGLSITVDTQPVTASLAPDGLPLVGYNAIPTAVPTPIAARPATIYEIDSLEPTATLTLIHTFKNADGSTRYTFTDTLGPMATRQYHVATIAQIPSPWVGSLTITTDVYQTDPPFQAGIVGYDYQQFDCPPLNIIKTWQ